MQYDKTVPSVLKTFYILTMTIAYTTRIVDVRIHSNHLQMIIGMIWIAIASAQSILNRFGPREIDRDDIAWLLKAYFVPQLLLHLYTMVLMIFGKVSWQFLTTNVSVYVPILVAISSIYLFGTKAIKYDLIAMFVSWFFSTMASIVVKGPIIFYHAIVQAYIDPLIDMKKRGINANYLELHDLVLAIGYVLTFYILTKKRPTKKNITIIFFTLLIMGLGMKRISIIGVFLVLLFHNMTKWLSIKKQYKVCILLGWCAFIFCYLFIWILSSGPAFYEFASKYDINLMGRNYYFSAIMGLSDFNFTFLGIGRHAIAKLLSSELSSLKVGGVHSDIIKMYVENGFIIFGMWSWYYLVHMTKAYKRHFGMDGAMIYFGIAIYTFALYLTDNTEIYFICQIFSITIPAVYVLKRKQHVFEREDIVKAQGRINEREDNRIYNGSL